MEEMKENQICLVIFEDGVCTTSRFCEPENYPNAKHIFKVPENTPLYEISDFFGYAKTPKTWEIVK